MLLAVADPKDWVGLEPTSVSPCNVEVVMEKSFAPDATSVLEDL